MKKFFLLSVLQLFLCLSLFGQDVPSIEEKIRNLSDTSGMYAIYTEIKTEDLAPEDLLELVKQLESKAVDYNYQKVRGLSLDLMGLQYREQGDVDQALETLNKAYNILISTGDTVQASWLDFDIAVTHYMIGQFDQSVEAATRNLEALKTLDGGRYNTLLRTAGEILRGAERLERAADYLRLAVDHSREKGMDESLAYNLNRLGVVYYQGSKHELAKETLEASLKLSREINLDRAITMNLNDMGELYFTLKDYQRCIELYQLALSRDMVDSDRSNTHNNIARLYWELERYDEAVEHADQALGIGLNTSYLPYILDAQKILAESYDKLGDYRKSVDYYQDYIASKDSLFKLETQQQLAEAETKYETAKKEQEIAALSEKEALERSRKQAYRTGLIAVGILLIIVLLLVWQISRNKKRIESQNRELGELNQTKDKFFSIIAHDLRSPMIALQGIGKKLDFFIRKGRHDKLQEMGGKIDSSIDRLNHLLNNLLNWAATESHGLPQNPKEHNTSDLLRETIDLYRGLAASKNISIEEELEDSPLFADRNMVSTIFRNLLSNAIKFSTDSGLIRISTTAREGYTFICFQDEGAGIAESRLKQLFSYQQSSPGADGEAGFGLGLKLCKEFADLNQGTIEVESAPGKGTTFTVGFPQTKQQIVVLKAA